MQVFTLLLFYVLGIFGNCWFIISFGGCRLFRHWFQFVGTSASTITLVKKQAIYYMSSFTNQLNSRKRNICITWRTWWVLIVNDERVHNAICELWKGKGITVFCEITVNYSQPLFRRNTCHFINDCHKTFFSYIFNNYILHTKRKWYLDLFRNRTLWINSRKVRKFGTDWTESLIPCKSVQYILSFEYFVGKINDISTKKSRCWTVEGVL